MLKNRKIKISEEQNKKLEVYAIIGLIIFATISYLFTHFLFKKDSRNISVFVNGTRITQVNGKPLDLNAQGIYTIGDKSGDFNTIEIKDMKVRCIDANCPDKVCVAHGYLNPEIDNDMIICAPHSLVIQYK